MEETSGKNHVRGKRAVKREILSLSAGLARTALDLVVLTAGLSGGLFLYGSRAKDRYAYRNLGRAVRFADRVFTRYRGSRVRQALSRAVSKGLLVKAGSGAFQLTVHGQRRLEGLLPSYKKQHKWDGVLWIITYDIPEVTSRKRDAFREHLEEIGCRIVQESVWLSVKDPRQWVKPFVAEHRLTGQVLISRLGRDGSIGEEDTKTLVQRLFQIRILERQYQRWILAVRRTPTHLREKHIIYFLGIIRDDPMLPKELLPSPWVGDEAKELFEQDVLPRSGDSVGLLKMYYP